MSHPLEMSSTEVQTQKNSFCQDTVTCSSIIIPAQHGAQDAKDPNPNGSQLLGVEEEGKAALRRHEERQPHQSDVNPRDLRRARGAGRHRAHGLRRHARNGHGWPRRWRWEATRRHSEATGS